MFFILSKTLYVLFLPLFWIVTLLLFSLFSKNSQRKKRLFITGLALLLFFSNEFILNQALRIWEVPATEISKVGQYDVGIVLTGIASYGQEPRDRVYLDKGSDRVLHTLQLYRLGKIKRILITGGSGRLSGDTISEASELLQVFLLCGIPSSDLIVEGLSVNTRENALFSKKILEQNKINDKALLITSAFHMRRARLCFLKVGLNPDIFSTDFYSHKTVYTLAELIFPSEKALSRWTILFHEILGIIAYKAAGYI
jgi:uncharacterized SAM-binding protein YcdF (DUF218 family)